MSGAGSHDLSETVVDQEDAYAAAVFMVVPTTMATPPLFVWAIGRAGGLEAQPSSAP